MYHTKWLHFVVVIALGLLYLPRVQCDNEQTTFTLDEATRKLALNLFREFSNKTRLAELIANGLAESQIEKFPAQPVAQIYRNYTLEQIRSLELELAQHHHFIYEPIGEKAREVKAEFGLACHSFEKDGDLKEFEQKFLQTGSELVALQKMVIRIINSKLEERLKSKTNYRSGRTNWIYTMFDRLSHLFLRSPIDAESLYKSNDQTQVNKMYVLIQALEKIEYAQPTDEQTRQNVDRLRSLLYRLRKVYQLNKIASVPNMYLNTEYLSPYNYEATLQLVRLLGAAQNIGERFNPLMTLFRSWMNFFNGGNLWSSLLNPLGSASSVTRRPAAKYDPQNIRRLMQILEDNDRVRQQVIERNRQKQALDTLINNQNKQQQQINDILTAIANKGTNNGQQSTTRPSWMPPEGPLSTASRPWPVLPPQIPTGQPVGNAGAGLQQLRDQRKQLNDLLQELQKPMPNGPSNSGAAALPSWPRPPPAPGTNPVGPAPGGIPSNRDIMQAQQALMSIMKNITPLINMMGQSGMVSMPRLEQSKFQLLNILNAVNNRAISESDEVEDAVKEMQRVSQLGDKLETVLDDIIDEADEKNKTL